MGDVMESGATLQVEREQLWRTLFMATGAIAKATLIAEADAFGKPMLRITGIQRDSLIKLLFEEFGPPIREPVKSGVGYLQGAAQLLFTFLTNPQLDGQP